MREAWKSCQAHLDADCCSWVAARVRGEQEIGVEDRGVRKCTRCETHRVCLHGPKQLFLCLLGPLGRLLAALKGQ